MGWRRGWWADGPMGRWSGSNQQRVGILKLLWSCCIMSLSISLSKQQLLGPRRADPKNKVEVLCKLCKSLSFFFCCALQGEGGGLYRGDLGRWAVTNKREARQLCEGPSKNNMAPWPACPAPAPVAAPAPLFPGWLPLTVQRCFAIRFCHFLYLFQVFFRDSLRFVRLCSVFFFFFFFFFCEMSNFCRQFWQFIEVRP